MIEASERYWFRVCKGKKGKRLYVLSKSFWKWIEEQTEKIKRNEMTKMELARNINEISNDKIPTSTAYGWVYHFFSNKSHSRKPIVIPNRDIPKLNDSSDPSVNSCIHGYRYFCPACGINKQNLNGSPVSTVWRTHKKGKIYTYEGFWKDFIDSSKRPEKLGVMPSQVADMFKIDSRVIRKWRTEGVKPQIYTELEFTFNEANLYWLGLHFSDGHLRNNGSNLSFTWQTGSSNPFQGYWYPQFVQSYLHIFSHKKNRSMTYVEYSKATKSWFFKTNISSFSPIFAKFLEKEMIIEKRKNTATSGYSKHLPRDLIKDLINREVLFQGIMDGDGSYNISDNHGMFIYLALDPSVKCDFIEELPLVPTTGKDINEKYVTYEACKGAPMREIRFVPSSLKFVPKRCTVNDIVNQLEFMIKSAENSIRPDKVHKLIAITKRISSKEYGEYRHCLEIQRKIRDEIRKRNLIKMIKRLEDRFPVSNGAYKPFIPKWAETLASSRVWKQEFWDFFLTGEFLEKKGYPNPELLDFSNGAPVDFDMTMSVRN